MSRTETQRKPRPRLRMIVMLIVVAVMAAPALFNYHRNRAAMDATYYALPSNTRIGYAMQYLILTAFLALAAHELHGQLPR